MELNAASVDAFTKLISNPKEYGFDFKPFKECFEESNTCTALHILYQNYIDYIQKPLPKVFFYIIMENTFGHPNGNDKNGNAGYFMVCS